MVSQSGCHLNTYIAGTGRFPRNNKILTHAFLIIRILHFPKIKFMEQEFIIFGEFTINELKNWLRSANIV
jgi:hypothetical protein